MSNWFMLTLVGRDRPGIVASVTSALFESGCHLGETSMLRLGDNFTIMMMVRDCGDEAALRGTLQPILEHLHLVLHVDAIDAVLHRRPVPDVCIIVHGADRAGIVSAVTSKAAAAGLNIVDLDSMVGGSEAAPIYVLQIEGVAAQGAEAIQTALEPLQAEGVKIDVRPIETFVG